MSDGRKKNDEMDVFMVRFLDFLTDVLNDPAIVAKNTPLFRSILAGLDLVTKDPDTSAQVKMSPADMKLAIRSIADNIDSLQTEAQIRLKIATTQQDIVTAQEELKKAALLNDMLSQILKNQNDAVKSAAANIR